jgi:hypothetical protein
MPRIPIFDIGTRGIISRGSTLLGAARLRARPLWSGLHWAKPRDRCSGAPFRRFAAGGSHPLSRPPLSVAARDGYSLSFIAVSRPMWTICCCRGKYTECQAFSQGCSPYLYTKFKSLTYCFLSMIMIIGDRNELKKSQLISLDWADIPFLGQHECFVAGHAIGCDCFLEYKSVFST